MNSDVGQVQSAGTCIGVDGSMFIPHKGPVTDPRYPSEVLPYEDGELPAHAQYLEESARNESEHLAEWMNNKTMFHSFAIVGDIHPHFEDWTESATAPQKATVKKAATKKSK
jgi:membrane protein required for beta-lactamase induction